MTKTGRCIRSGKLTAAFHVQYKAGTISLSRSILIKTGGWRCGNGLDACQIRQAVKAGNRWKRGELLVETIVAIAVFVVVMVAVSAMVAVSYHMLNASREQYGQIRQRCSGYRNHAGRGRLRKLRTGIPV